VSLFLRLYQIGRFRPTIDVRYYNFSGRVRLNFNLFFLVQKKWNQFILKSLESDYGSGATGVIRQQFLHCCHPPHARMFLLQRVCFY